MRIFRIRYVHRAHTFGSAYVRVQSSQSLWMTVCQKAWHKINRLNIMRLLSVLNFYQFVFEYIETAIWAAEKNIYFKISQRNHGSKDSLETEPTFFGFVLCIDSIVIQLPIDYRYYCRTKPIIFYFLATRNVSCWRNHFSRTICKWQNIKAMMIMANMHVVGTA